MALRGVDAIFCSLLDLRDEVEELVMGSLWPTFLNDDAIRSRFEVTRSGVRFGPPLSADRGATEGIGVHLVADSAVTRWECRR